MGAIKNNPDFAKRAGVPQKVGAEFIAADKARGSVKLLERVQALSGADKGVNQQGKMVRKGPDKEINPKKEAKGMSKNNPIKPAY